MRKGLYSKDAKSGEKKAKLDIRRYAVD